MEYQVSLFEKRISTKSFKGETFPVFWSNLGLYLRFLKDATDLAVERSGGRWRVGYTDSHPSMDCVVGWIGQSELSPCSTMIPTS